MLRQIPPLIVDNISSTIVENLSLFIPELIIIFAVVTEIFIFLYDYYKPSMLHKFISCKKTESTDKKTGDNANILLRGSLSIVLLSVVGSGIGKYLKYWMLYKV